MLIKNPNRTLWVGIFLSFIVMGTGIWLIYKNIQSQTLTLLSHQHKMNQFHIDEFKQMQSQVITTLTEDSDIQNYISEKNIAAETLFYHFLKADTQIMQLRLIDLNGNEQIRFDRLRNGILYQTPVAQLQNKANRPYFKEFSALAKNSIGVSDFDLNIEHGKVDLPFNPTLRIGMPIYKEGVKQGIIVINYYMNNWIKDLQQHNNSHLFLVDNEGYFLIHPDEKWAWSRYLSPQKKAEEYFHISTSNFTPLKKGEYRWINNNTVAFAFDLYGQRLLALYQPQISPNEILIRRLIQFSSIILLSVLLIVIPLLKIIRFNVHQIEEEKSKNEMMAIHQSKLDAMGDMIAVISHQWRQPLNSIGLIMQDLVSAFNHHELDKTYFETSQKGIMDQLHFMSQTIETFRNFFYTDKDENSCNLIDIVNELQRLYKMQFKTYGIILEIVCKNSLGETYPLQLEAHPERFNLSTHSTEIKHILLNLISNAKDAVKQFQLNEESKHIITLTLSSDNDAICIDLTDHAGGIDPSIAEQIFNPYFTTKESGTGLGLYIAKTLTEHFIKGDLTVKTNMIEGWSTFTLRIPHTTTDLLK